MKTILCFGDSNTWGYNPLGTGRHPWSVRWTGQLQHTLGPEVRIVEEGLNGRTTAFDDPLMPDRNGHKALPMLLDTHAPIDLLVIMLGTNDTKTVFNLSPYVIAEGVQRVVATAQSHANAPGRILLVAPTPLVPTDNAHINAIFMDAIGKSTDLALHYRRIADASACCFWNAGSVAHASPIDGLHLDAEAHTALARGLAPRIRQALD